MNFSHLVSGEEYYHRAQQCYVQGKFKKAERFFFYSALLKYQTAQFMLQFGIKNNWFFRQKLWMRCYITELLEHITDYPTLFELETLEKMLINYFYLSVKTKDAC